MPTPRFIRKQNSSVLSWGGIELDASACKISRMGRHSRLTPKDFALLQLLMSHIGVEFSREVIIARIWGSRSDVDVRTVDVMIARVRRALNKGFLSDPIRSVRGFGYKIDETFDNIRTKPLPIRKRKLQPAGPS